MSIEPTVVVTSAASVSTGATAVEVVKAYIGPGPGLGAVGAMLALIGAGVLMVIGFVWYPVKRLTRRWKATRAAREDTVAKS